MPTPADAFALALRRAIVAERGRLGLSQADLGARMGWSRQVASNTETGVRTIPAYELPALCAALECTLAELVQKAPESERRKLGLP